MKTVFEQYPERIKEPVRQIMKISYKDRMRILYLSLLLSFKGMLPIKVVDCLNLLNKGLLDDLNIKVKK